MTPEEIKALVQMARAEGLKSLTFQKSEWVSVHFELGAAPAPAPAAPESPRVLTDEEREAAEKAGKRAAKRLRLRKLLGRDPTEEEVEELP